MLRKPVLASACAAACLSTAAAFRAAPRLANPALLRANPTLNRTLNPSLSLSRRSGARGFATMSAETFPVALVQLSCGSDKAENIERARSKVAEAAAAGAKLVSLPECWNSPYATSAFPEYAEVVPGVGGAADPAASPSAAAIIAMAKENNIFLVGGSVPERDEATGKIYNTCIVVDPDGNIVARHRKVHLFDIDVPGGITFKESDTLSPGESATMFDTPMGKVGVGICYDIRFPELSMLMRSRGAVLLLFPGAFNMTTGPRHWELLARARAVDNQCFVAVTSPARVPGADYQAWGHSSVVDPWGEVVSTTEHEEDIVYADVNLSMVPEIRQAIPVSMQKRPDIYELQDRQA